MPLRRVPPLITLTLLIGGLTGLADPDTLFGVDLYGLRCTSETDIRTAIGLRAGDPVPPSFDSIGARLRRLPQIEDVDISPVCCADDGRTMLYVGVRERGTPPVTFRVAPTGAARLPTEVLHLGDRFESALVRAVQGGASEEDHSQGYALARDSTLRAVQQAFVRVAAERFDSLVAVSRHAQEARHRALATQIIAYGPDRRRVARELLYAASDASESVRNNAVRAIAVLADWATQNADSGVSIPDAPFIELLNSVKWTDRNKGIMVLMPLTATRDPALLGRLRARALPSLVEMARWSHPGHALGPFIVIARIAGIDEGVAFQAFQSGEREGVITRALVEPPTDRHLLR